MNNIYNKYEYEDVSLLLSSTTAATFFALVNAFQDNLVGDEMP